LIEITTNPTAENTTTPLANDQIFDEPLTEKDAKSSVNAMKHCYQSFTKDPSDLSLLNELHCHAHSFSERARVSGFIALHRLGSAFAHLMGELYKFPELVNNSSVRTINQTIEFLSVLVKQRDYAALKDPAKAQVYAVDDDADNVEAIKLAMESAMLRTHTTQEPAIALAELASSRFDLIFLDVNLPQIDGFELCQQIRQLAIHSRTPIVFLTGLNTVENRVQSSLSGGNDFVGKPFNLHELSVKALTLILKGSLNLE
jgi:PleD family two-component response regulator